MPTLFRETTRNRPYWTTKRGPVLGLPGATEASERLLGSMVGIRPAISIVMDRLRKLASRDGFGQEISTIKSEMGPICQRLYEQTERCQGRLCGRFLNICMGMKAFADFVSECTNTFPETGLDENAILAETLSSSVV